MVNWLCITYLIRYFNKYKYNTSINFFVSFSHYLLLYHPLTNSFYLNFSNIPIDKIFAKKISYWELNQVADYAGMKRTALRDSNLAN